MEVIIIIMVVVGVITNIMKAAGQAQQQQANRPGRGTGFPGMDGIPGKGYQPPVNTSPSYDTVSAGTTKRRETNPLRENSRPTEAMSMSSYTPPESMRPTVSVAKASPALQVRGLAQAQVHHKLDFSRNALINSIVLSEVLAPPKARRQNAR